jgi:hypothetical protein
MMPCKEIKMRCIHYDVSLYCIYMFESHDLYKIEAFNTPNQVDRLWFKVKLMLFENKIKVAIILGTHFEQLLMTSHISSSFVLYSTLI